MLQEEFEKFFNEIEVLLNGKLIIEETFYFASLIHLVFEKIHPFPDGNGRAGRLLEKWFLSKTLGKKAWNIELEKYYFLNREKYYAGLKIGNEYANINYDLCLPFLLLLPESLKQ